MFLVYTNQLDEDTCADCILYFASGNLNLACEQKKSCTTEKVVSKEDFDNDSTQKTFGT